MLRKIGRFIDPLTDFGFKLLFGSEPNKNILIAFLNDLFTGQKEITDLVFSPTERQGDNDKSKNVFFDLLCTGTNGEQFIIEMQRAEQRYFKDRVVFYTSRAITGQLSKGKSHWNNELKEVYLIAILEFSFKDSAPGRYLHNVALMNTATHEIFYNKLGYKFLELPNFVKTEEELETDLDKWFFLLKYMSHLDKIPAVLNKRVFQQVFKIAEISNLTKEEREMYDSSLKSKWDYENSITFAEEQAEERGVGKGIEMGIEQGREEEKVAMITNLIVQIGLSNEQIASVANVSVNFVKQIREGLKK